jgi:hypothetical protein
MSKIDDIFSTLVTSERIKKLRDEKGCGMVTAKEILQNRALILAIEEIETIEDVRDFLRWQHLIK